MFYLAWKFREFSPLGEPDTVVDAHLSYLVFMQVFDQPDDRETGGMFFPMAINNLCAYDIITIQDLAHFSKLVVGLYIEQICLTCLFFLNVSAAGTPALVEACFMIVLIILTACAQLLLHSGFHRETTITSATKSD